MHSETKQNMLIGQRVTGKKHNFKECFREGTSEEVTSDLLFERQEETSHVKMRFQMRVLRSGLPDRQERGKVS